MLSSTPRSDDTDGSGSDNASSTYKYDLAGVLYVYVGSDVDLLCGILGYDAWLCTPGSENLTLDSSNGQLSQDQVGVEASSADLIWYSFCVTSDPHALHNLAALSMIHISFGSIVEEERFNASV